MGPFLLHCTARAPTNIAVIKYWGKRDEKLILPLNSSVSVTLDLDDLSATTTVAASPDFTEDRLWLNGEAVALSSARYQQCLQQLRARAGTVTDARTGAVVGPAEWQRLKLHIASVNNFPTAAGLASSAAGFACLVFALARLMGVEEAYPGELSALARQGSGSACRSLYGGFVKWEMGQAPDGRDSVAVQVAPADSWPELCALVAVVSARKKETSSTSGMRESVVTSELLKHRAQVVVPARMARMEAAIRGRDFEAFAALTCADSNQFHAVCLDTTPPIFYMNDFSKRLIATVERWNKEAGRAMAAYTFDAGPNAVMFTLEHNLPALVERVNAEFPPPTDADLDKYLVGSRGLQAAIVQWHKKHGKTLLPKPTAPEGGIKNCGELQYLICTRPGRGAECLESEESHLLDLTSGLPRTLK